MKKYSQIAFMVFGIMLVSGSIQAQVVSNTSENDAQDVSAAIVENASTDADQDAVSSSAITSNTATDVDQDAIVAGVTSNTGTNNDQDISSTVVSNTSTDDDQNVGQVVTPVVTTNTDTQSNSGSRGGSSSHRSRNSSSSVTSSDVGIASCPLIKGFMKINSNNDRAEVQRLQNFLSTTEKFAVTITGEFDSKTEEAVKSFQKKYQNDILAPWGATIPSGVVYITTAKKINEIACAKPIVLTADQVAIIESYKTRAQTPASTETVETGTSDVQDGTTTAPVGEIGTVTTPEETNAAAVGKASILSRFWGFIKGLFN